MTPELNIGAGGILGYRDEERSWPVVDVIKERLAQREEFSDAVDDVLEPAEWIARLVKHTGRAVSQDPQVFRREMVICGAMALAALEAFDRRFAP